MRKLFVDYPRLWISSAVGCAMFFSFTIAAACRTVDVSTLNTGVRKVVIAHTLISFLFNATILGFAINVTAGLIGGG